MLNSVFLQNDILDIIERLGNSVKILSDRTILIAGGLGFLGRYFLVTLNHLNEYVLEKPVKVIILDNLISSGVFNQENVNFSHVTFFNQDIRKPLHFEQHLDYIVHAAGIASPYYYRRYPFEALDASISGTKNLLEIAKTHNARFTFFSSSEVYGDPLPQYVPIMETYRGNVSSMGPRACYDEGKRVGETLCYIYSEYYGTHTNCIRPFNIFGPGMQERDYRVMPNFASKIKAGQSLDIYGNGTQTRTFTYITDAMIGFFLTILQGLPTQVYNIGNPTPEVSMVDLVKIMSNVLKKKIDYNLINYPDSYPADEPQRRCPDISKANRELGFSPTCSLEDGLFRFLGWSDKIYTGIVDEEALVA